ncbi:S41 family peptidase [Ferruginibacter sp. SUN106]|uniref:S41 family peptidase n=1 Tax=Ferruginibacter sp. SUN106 TaxID=2978348 RepID=UPI003D367B1E
MKIKTFFFILLICTVSCIKAQMPDSVKLVLDSSISLLQQYALHAKTTNWPVVKQIAYAKAENAKTWNELDSSIAYLFQSVNDHHGWLSAGDAELRWHIKTEFRFSEAVKNEMAKGNRFVKKILTGNIGYLRVPGMMVDTSQYNKKAQQLMDSLFSLEKSGAAKIIIDLRLNGGGTMFPMIAGLSPLLGNGKFIGGANSEGVVESMSVLENGKFCSEDGGAAKVVNSCRQLSPKTTVVILTSNLTGSAGECVAVAFKGRKNTRFIGETTAGFTIGNNGHWIIKGKAGIVIAESAIVDRNKNIYYYNVQPDEMIWGGDNFDDYLQDKKIQAAIRWFSKH